MANIKSMVGIEAPEFKGKGLLENESTAYTQDVEDSTKKIATTEFVHAVVANLVASAPETLDTLNELAAALGNDENFATTITESLSKKVNSSDLKILDDGNGDLTFVGIDKSRVD